MADIEALRLLRAPDEGVAAKTGHAFFDHLVGSSKTVKADVRVIAATNRDLLAGV